VERKVMSRKRNIGRKVMSSRDIVVVVVVVVAARGGGEKT
jgi:hypothetical protein